MALIQDTDVKFSLIILSFTLLPIGASLVAITQAPLRLILVIKPGS